MAGVFVVVGLVGASIILWILLAIRRRRRSRTRADEHDAIFSGPNNPNNRAPLLDDDDNAAIGQGSGSGFGSAHRRGASGTVGSFGSTGYPKRSLEMMAQASGQGMPLAFGAAGAALNNNAPTRPQSTYTDLYADEGEFDPFAAAGYSHINNANARGNPGPSDAGPSTSAGPNAYVSTQPTTPPTPLTPGHSIAEHMRTYSSSSYEPLLKRSPAHTPPMTNLQLPVKTKSSSQHLSNYSQEDTPSRYSDAIGGSGSASGSGFLGGSGGSRGEGGESSGHGEKRKSASGMTMMTSSDEFGVLGNGDPREEEERPRTILKVRSSFVPIFYRRSYSLIFCDPRRFVTLLTKTNGNDS